MEKVKKSYVINRNNYVSLLILLAIAAGAVAELFAIMSSRANSGYQISVLDDVMLYSEIAVGLLVAEFVLSTCLKGRISSILLDLLRFGAVALFCICMYYVLVERADLMGYVWFSTLESDNEASVNALNYGVISAALYVAAIIICAVTGGFDMVTSIKEKRTRESIQAEIAALEEELNSMPAEDGQDDPFADTPVTAAPAAEVKAAPAAEAKGKHTVQAAPAQAAKEPAARTEYTTVYYNPVAEDKYANVTDDFIKTLTLGEKNEFLRLFVLEGSKPIDGVPAYVIGGDNREFFSALFLRLGKTRSIVSDGLMAKISDYHSVR